MKINKSNYSNFLNSQRKWRITKHQIRRGDQQQKASSIVLRPVYGWSDTENGERSVALEGCDIVIK